VETVKKVGEEDISALNPWEKIEKLGPSGLWSSYKDKTLGTSSIDQFGMYLRKLVPDFVAKGFFPNWFLENLKTIKKIGTDPRDLHIPCPSDMESLLAFCEAKDGELGALIRAFAYSGARKEGLLGKKGLTWERVDFKEDLITLIEKGSKKRTVPMGPQLRAVLAAVRARSTGEGRVFPIGSTREDRAQEILKEAAATLNAEVRDMHFFHALRHYFSTTHMQQGTPDQVVDALMGHSPDKRNAANSYRHVALAAMRDAVAKVIL